jgi:hypothetical protein
VASALYLSHEVKICPATQCPGDGYAELPLGQAEGKPIKSIHIYQDEEALNIDLEFEDLLMLEMIFRVGFRSTINLLENRNGVYHLRKRIKPKRSVE